jgi:hypothetical protein
MDDDEQQSGAGSGQQGDSGQQAGDNDDSAGSGGQSLDRPDDIVTDLREDDSGRETRGS